MSLVGALFVVGTMSEIAGQHERLPLQVGGTMSEIVSPPIRGRFAPSPTGDLHLGNLRTALLAWLFARSAGGRFLMRMEDLDTARVRPGAEERQLADLRAIGIDWDGPVVRQSERLALYAAAIEG